jgi:hypothetical protein
MSDLNPEIKSFRIKISKMRQLRIMSRSRPPTPEHEFARLAAYVEQRRESLDASQTDFDRVGGLGQSWTGKLERLQLSGRPKPATLKKLAHAIVELAARQGITIDLADEWLTLMRLAGHAMPNLGDEQHTDTVPTVATKPTLRSKMGGESGNHAEPERTTLDTVELPMHLASKLWEGGPVSAAPVERMHLCSPLEAHGATRCILIDTAELAHAFELEVGDILYVRDLAPGEAVAPGKRVLLLDDGVRAVRIARENTLGRYLDPLPGHKASPVLMGPGLVVDAEALRFTRAYQ